MKAHQRTYLLRKLNSFSVCKTIMSRFYNSFIESVICFSFVCWFHNLSVKNRNALLKIVNVCSKIIGEQQRDLSQFCNTQTRKKARLILSIADHVLQKEYELLPSCRRFRAQKCKTNRFKFSFIPTSVRLLNEREECAERESE